MSFGTWDVVFNAVMAVFWFRIWAGEDRGLASNPYLSPLARLTDQVAHFLRPVLFGLSTRRILWICLVFLIIGLVSLYRMR